MVWGAFSRQGTLTLAFPSTHMDSNEYQDVLAANLVPFLAANPGQNRVLQQDNAPVHVSRSTKAWMQAQGIVTMAWPALSPDVNPMETFGESCLERFTRKDGLSPTSTT